MKRLLVMTAFICVNVCCMQRESSPVVRPTGATVTIPPLEGRGAIVSVVAEHVENLIGRTVRSDNEIDMGGIYILRPVNTSVHRTDNSTTGMSTDERIRVRVDSVNVERNVELHGVRRVTTATINNEGVDIFHAGHFPTQDDSDNVFIRHLHSSVDENREENSLSRVIIEIENPLMDAAKHGDIMALKREVNRAWDREGRTVLEFLTAYKNRQPWSQKELFDYIDSLNDVVNIQDENGNTPLIFAAQNGDLNVGKYLIDFGADVNKGDKYGNTPLMKALNSNSQDLRDLMNHYNLVIYLIEHGADVNKGNNEGYTPLHKAVDLGSYGLTKYLVEHGADTEKRDNHKDTPLLRATEQGNYTLVSYLVEHGANVNQEGNYGRTPLLVASSVGDHRLINYLIDHGADVNEIGVDGYTPLSWAMASYSTHLEMIVNLVNRGANVNESRGRLGETSPLIEAAHIGDHGLIRYLVEKGADINKKGSNGEAPLQIVRRKAREIEDYLIGQGAH